MSNSIALYQASLEPMVPQLQQITSPLGVDARRIVQTALVSLDRTPRLRECTVQSVINSCVTAAVAGLVVDGWSGQGFIIPYNVKGTQTAQFQLGYKGYSTIAARSGFTVNSGVVYEADDFDFEEGSSPFVRHKKHLGKNRGEIIGTWATFTSRSLPAVIRVIGIDEIYAIKGRSQGAKKADSPWNDMKGPGFPAMAAKTAIRQAGRSMPIVELQRVIALDDAHEERGKSAHLSMDGALILEGEAEKTFPDRAPPVTEIRTRQPRFTITVQQRGEKVDRQCAHIEDWASKMGMAIDALKSLDHLEAFAERNRDNVITLQEDYPDETDAVSSRLDARRDALSLSGTQRPAQGEDASGRPDPADTCPYDGDSPEWFVWQLERQIPKLTSIGMVDQLLDANEHYFKAVKPEWADAVKQMAQRHALTLED